MTPAHRIGLMGVAAGALLAGCVVVPYTPKAEVTLEPAVIDDAERTWVTVGPRRFLEAFAGEITRTDPQFRVADGVGLRDALYPQGGWTLAGLLQETNRPNLAACGADFLVILGPQRDKSETRGGMVFSLGFVGAMKSKESSAISVMIVDLRKGTRLGDQAVRATGTAAGVGAFYAVGLLPRMGKSLQQGVASAVVQAVRKIQPAGVVHIGVLACEDGGRQLDQEAAEEAQNARAAQESSLQAVMAELTWTLNPDHGDWVAAFGRLSAADQDFLRSHPLTLAATGPANDGEIRIVLSAADQAVLQQLPGQKPGPAHNVPEGEGVDPCLRLDIAGICAGFTHAFGGDAATHRVVVRTLTHSIKRGAEHESHIGQPVGFRLDWTLRDAGGRTVEVSASEFGPSVSKGVVFATAFTFQWAKLREATRANTRQTFALALLKLAIKALQES